MYEDTEERLAIREKVSNMSFEELAKLKDKLGTQVYNEAVFGVRKKTTIAKRVNKNRPLEVSSKISPRELAVKKSEPSTSASATAKRDPRFDHLCGEFDSHKFKEDYEFINDIKNREKEELKKELEKVTNEHRKEEIRYLITRMENQDRAEQMRKKAVEKRNQEYEKHINMLQEGKKPRHVKKADRRILDLVERYEELKKKGKVEKAIKKYRSLNKGRDFKKLPSSSH